MKSKAKVYKLNGVSYLPKEKYSLKDWGAILRILSSLNLEDQLGATVALLSGDSLTDFLNIIFTEPVKGEIYEDDFEEVTRAINDFLTRKKI